MTFSQQIAALLKHSWLGFRRAHYFRRSLGIRLLMVFSALLFLWYAHLLGLLMPVWLRELFPEKETREAFFSLWLFLFVADLLFRLSMQKIPRQMIRAYLHLPIRRSTLASWMLFRSWISIYNLYLVVLLLPFFRTAFLLPGDTLLFWRVLVATVLLIGFNHSLSIWVRAWLWTRPAWAVTGLVLTGGALLAAILSPPHLMQLSLRLGEAVMEGRIHAMAWPLPLILLLQSLSHRGLTGGMARFTTSASPGLAGRTSWPEGILSAVPRYGQLWELEWRLITRNKRSLSGLRQWPLFIIGLPLFFYFDPFDNASQFLYLMVMVAGGYGFFHLQYVFSWESRFFDFIASRQIDMREFIRAKYLFYVMMGLLMMLPVLLTLAFLIPEMLWPMAGIAAYAMGPVFAWLFYIGLGSSTRIDPNKRAMFNMEGSSGTLFFVVFVSMFSVLILAGVAYVLPLPDNMGLSLLTGVPGLAFMLWHPWWTAAIAAKFHRRKYSNLSKYRE